MVGHFDPKNVMKDADSQVFGFESHSKLLYSWLAALLAIGMGRDAWCCRWRWCYS